MASFGSLKQAVFDREARKQQYQDHVRGLNAYDRHKKFLHDYVSYYGKEKSSAHTFPVKTDQDTLREGYRFIRTEEDDMNPSWEQRLVKRYYDKLFKEYCIADMSHYKTGKIGLRWRTEKEVMSGKEMILNDYILLHCQDSLYVVISTANRKKAYQAMRKVVFGTPKSHFSPHTEIKTVNFSYFEAGESKQALVKLVACQECAEKLYYKKRKEKEQLKRKEDSKHRAKRGRSDSDDDANERSKERRKGKKTSASALASGQKVDEEDGDFEEYLEGMFP